MWNGREYISLILNEMEQRLTPATESKRGSANQCVFVALKVSATRPQRKFWIFCSFRLTSLIFKNPESTWRERARKWDAFLRTASVSESSTILKSGENFPESRRLDANEIIFIWPREVKVLWEWQPFKLKSIVRIQLYFINYSACYCKIIPKMDAPYPKTHPELLSMASDIRVLFRSGSKR